MEEGRHEREEEANRQEVDHAGNISFPASDATTHGKPTSTERPGRPVDRNAPHVTKEQIDQAQRGEDHKHQRGG
jgi:hypothetical protein